MNPRNDNAPGVRRVAGGLRARRIWLASHRWLGLTVGLVFALIGLTGSLLVFDHAIDEWLHPSLLLSEGTGTRQPVAAVISAAEEAFPDSHARAASVTRPRVENGVWTVWFASGTTQVPTFTAVHVDPYSAAVTGQRVWGEDLMTWVYRLHYQMFSGRVGAICVGLIGIVVLVSIVSGIYLWWPLWKHSWRAALAVRRGSRFTYDLHKTFGIVSSLALLAITFTGVYMEFPEVFRSTASALVAFSDPPAELSSTVQGAVRRLSADEALARAQSIFPDAEFDHLHPPVGEDGTYEIAFRQSDEVQRSYGRTQVFLDQYSGDVLAIRSPLDFTAADVFIAWQYPLHNGEAFGLVGRWVVLFIGLTPAILAITGFLIWWRKRQSKRRSARGRSVIEKVASSSVPPSNSVPRSSIAVTSGYQESSRGTISSLVNATANPSTLEFQNADPIGGKCPGKLMHRNPPD